MAINEQLKLDIATKLADNDTREISEQDLRDITNSLNTVKVEDTTYQTEKATQDERISTNEEGIADFNERVDDLVISGGGFDPNMENNYAARQNFEGGITLEGENITDYFTNVISIGETTASSYDDQAKKYTLQFEIPTNTAIELDVKIFAYQSVQSTAAQFATWQFGCVPVYDQFGPDYWVGFPQTGYVQQLDVVASRGVTPEGGAGGAGQWENQVFSATGTTDLGTQGCIIQSDLGSSVDPFNSATRGVKIVGTASGVVTGTVITPVQGDGSNIPDTMLCGIQVRSSSFNLFDMSMRISGGWIKWREVEGEVPPKVIPTLNT